MACRSSRHSCQHAEARPRRIARHFRIGKAGSISCCAHPPALQRCLRQRRVTIPAHPTGMPQPRELGRLQGRSQFHSRAREADLVANDESIDWNQRRWFRKFTMQIHNACLPPMIVLAGQDYVSHYSSRRTHSDELDAIAEPAPVFPGLQVANQNSICAENCSSRAGSWLVMPARGSPKPEAGVASFP